MTTTELPAFILKWCNTGEDMALPGGPRTEYFDTEDAAKVRRSAIDPWQMKSVLRPFIEEKDRHGWAARTQ